MTARRSWPWKTVLLVGCAAIGYWFVESGWPPGEPIGIGVWTAALIVVLQA